MTYLGLLDIYTDFAFITITYKEGLMEYFGPSIFFFLLTMAPKIYSYYLLLWIMIKKPNDDKRRKYTFKAFTFSEFRV